MDRGLPRQHRHPHPPLSQVVLFHHGHGLTAGVRALADDFRAAGHQVHLPDLFEGRTFADLADGVRHTEEVGFGTILERGRLAADELPGELVYAGLSLGVLPAQMLAQTRPGARGAVLLHSCVPPSEFGGAWPDAVAVQIHLSEDDEWVLPPNEDLAAARRLAEDAPRAELFLYPGGRHLFTDNSLPHHDDAAAALAQERILRFLDAIG